MEKSRNITQKGRSRLKVRFMLTFKQGPKTIAEVKGMEDVISATGLTLEDVTENVIKTEQFLEKLTGLRCHIQQIS
jgi:hypothetical protein